MPHEDFRPGPGRNEKRNGGEIVAAEIREIVVSEIYRYYMILLHTNQIKTSMVYLKVHDSA